MIVTIIDPERGPERFEQASFVEIQLEADETIIFEAVNKNDVQVYRCTEGGKTWGSQS